MVGKVDYNLNERNSFSGMYFFGNNSGTVEDFPELQQKWLSRFIPGLRWSAETGFGLLVQDGSMKPASVTTGFTNPRCPAI